MRLVAYTAMATVVILGTPITMGIRINTIIQAFLRFRPSAPIRHGFR